MQRANIVLSPNETALLNLFFAKITQFDPDVIIGHNFFGYDLDVLLHRIKVLSSNLCRPMDLIAATSGPSWAGFGVLLCPRCPAATSARRPRLW